MPFCAAVSCADGIEHLLQSPLDAFVALLVCGDYSGAAHSLRLEHRRGDAHSAEGGTRVAGHHRCTAHRHVLRPQRADSDAWRRVCIAAFGAFPYRHDGAQSIYGMARQLFHGTYPDRCVTRSQATTVRQGALAAYGLLHSGAARGHHLAYDE